MDVGAHVVLLDEPGQDLLVRRIARGVQQVDVPADELAVAQHEQLDGRLVVLAGHADEVQLGLRERLHLLALHRPLDGPDLVAQGGGALVLGPLGGDRHLGPQCLDERLLPTLQEQLHLGDVLRVVGLGDRLDARALAALDVIQQARPLERLDPVRDLHRAGPEREQASDQVHRLVDARRRRVWPEVAAPVVDELARPLDAREVVAVGDLDVRVALVVLEPDVEARPEALDEVRLQQEGLGDGVGQGDLEVRHPVDDAPDPVDLAGRRRLLPVPPDAVAQALGLADVQDLAAGPLHQVHAGRSGSFASADSSSGVTSDARAWRRTGFGAAHGRPRPPGAGLGGSTGHRGRPARHDEPPECDHRGSAQRGLDR